MSPYCVYELQGDNALSFLQGQITNDVLNIKDEAIVPALLCNVQGRILLMLRVSKKKDNIFLILRDDLRDVLEKTLTKVAALSRVKLVWRDTLSVAYQDNFMILDQAPQHTPSMLEWQLNKIKKKEFDIYPASSGLFLPHDLHLEKDWVSFSKGCYRGQEIIARMHYLGKSKYYLVYSESNDQNLSPGDKIDSQTQVVDCVREKEKVHLLLCVKKIN